MQHNSELSEVEDKVASLITELIRKQWGELTITIKAQGGKLVYIKGGVTQGHKLTKK